MTSASRAGGWGLKEEAPLDLSLENGESASLEAILQLARPIAPLTPQLSLCAWGSQPWALHMLTGLATFDACQPGGL